MCEKERSTQHPPLARGDIGGSPGRAPSLHTVATLARRFAARDPASGRRRISRDRACHIEATAMTLIETLVVISIVALLVAMLLPSVAASRGQAKRVTCLSNQRQIALAMHAYADDHDGRLPIAYYYDAAHLAFVAWDTITYAGDPGQARAGLIWEYVTGNGVQQCPSYLGPSMTTGDPYTGYNYNTTYLGRGQSEGRYQGMGESPAHLSHVRFPGKTALVGDGGWRGGANKFMRAPLDTGVGEGAVHAGAQAYRHLDRTNTVHVDGHGEWTRRRFHKPGARPLNDELLDWPKNAFLSEDDEAYAHR